MATEYMQQTHTSGETVFFFSDHSTGEQEQLCTRNYSGHGQQSIGIQTDYDITGTGTIANTKEYNSTGTETDLNAPANRNTLESLLRWALAICSICDSGPIRYPKAVSDRKTLELHLRWALAICTTENSDSVPIGAFSSLSHSERESVQLISSGGTNQGVQSKIPCSSIDKGRVGTEKVISRNANGQAGRSHFTNVVGTSKSVCSGITQPSTLNAGNHDPLKDQAAISGEPDLTLTFSEHLKETAVQDYEMESTEQPRVDVNRVQDVQENEKYTSSENRGLIMKESGVNEKSDCAMEQYLHVSDQLERQGRVMRGLPLVQGTEGTSGLEGNSQEMQPEHHKVMSSLPLVDGTEATACLEGNSKGMPSGLYVVDTILNPVGMVTPVADTTMLNAPMTPTQTSLHGGEAIIRSTGSKSQRIGSRPSMMLNSPINQTTDIPTTSTTLDSEMRLELPLPPENLSGTTEHHPGPSLQTMPHYQTTTNLPPLKCIVCDISFPDLQSLADHENLHESWKKFQCNICDKKFTRKDYLKRHAIQHSAEGKVKSFECNLCNKKFTRKDGLKRHTRNHTGEKPYDCPECPDQFKYLRELQKHILDEHGRTL